MLCASPSSLKAERRTQSTPRPSCLFHPSAFHLVLLSEVTQISRAKLLNNREDGLRNISALSQNSGEPWMHLRGSPTAEGTEGWRWGVSGGGLAVGSEDAHSSHPPPHLSVTGSLAVRELGMETQQAFSWPQPYFSEEDEERICRGWRTGLSDIHVLPTLGGDARSGHYKMYDVHTKVASLGVESSNYLYKETSVSLKFSFHSQPWPQRLNISENKPEWSLRECLHGTFILKAPFTHTGQSLYKSQQMESKLFPELTSSFLPSLSNCLLFKWNMCPYSDALPPPHLKFISH